MNTLPDNESLTVEFKTSFNDEVIETLVAFSNAKGGTVYVGVSDTGKVQGITIGKETIQQWINEIKNKTSPQIIPDAEVLTIEDKEIISLFVQEYPIKPVSMKGKYYKRVSNSNHLLSVMEVTNMHLQTVNTSWDYYPRPNKTIDDISLGKVEKAMNIIKRRDDNFQFESVQEFLLKNELIFEDNRITNGCFLMFSKGENLYTTVQMGHFASEIVIKDDVVNSDDILTQIEEVMLFIRKHISKELIITNTQIENIQRWQYPLDALREIVLNMIVHRDYTASSNSIIKIFSDRILFFNPGILPDSITIEQLKTNQYVSTPRNRQIAKMAKEMGIIERYGTGIRRVRNMFIDYGLEEPRYEIISGGMTVTVFGLIFETDNSELTTDKNVEETVGTVEETVGTVGETVEETVGTVGETVEETVGTVEETVGTVGETVGTVEETVGTVRETVEETVGTVEETVEKIMARIKEKPKTTIKELVELTGLSRRGIEWNIKNLKDKGLIERIGSSKNGYWNVKTEIVPETMKKNNVEVTDDAGVISEKSRVIPEKSRVIPEKGRVIPEKGRVILEKSRVISEKSRVKDEEKSREIIIKLIKNNAFITQKEIAETIRLSIKGVEKNIKYLKIKGLIERVGTNKNGYWKINEKDIEKDGDKVTGVVTSEGTSKGTSEETKGTNKGTSEGIKGTSEETKGTNKGTSEGTKGTSENTKGTSEGTNNQQKIIANISKNPYITSKELSIIVGIRADKIRKNLTKLKTKGLIERVGTNRSGYWIIKKLN